MAELIEEEVEIAQPAVIHLPDGIEARTPSVLHRQVRFYRREDASAIQSALSKLRMASAGMLWSSRAWTAPDSPVYNAAEAERACVRKAARAVRGNSALTC
jgi:hypothetical protein